MKRSLLKNLSINEISLVDDPANPEAVIEIWKRNGSPEDAGAEAFAKYLEALADGDPESFESAMARIKALKANDAEMEMLWSAHSAFMTSIRSILSSEKGGGPTIAETADQYSEAVKEISSRLVGKSSAGIDPAITKAADEAAAYIQEFAMDLEAIEKALEEANEKIEALTKERDEAVAKSGTTADPDEVWKSSLAPAVRERIEKMEREAAEDRALIKKMADNKAEAVAIEKAKAFGVGDAEQIGPALARIAKAADEADVALIEDALTKAGKAVKDASLFKSAGVNAGNAVNFEGDPEAVVKAAAEEIQKADGCTYEVAYTKALERNPEAYTALEQERIAKVRAAQ